MLYFGYGSNMPKARIEDRVVPAIGLDALLSSATRCGFTRRVRRTAPANAMRFTPATRTMSYGVPSIV